MAEPRTQGDLPVVYQRCALRCGYIITTNLFIRNTCTLRLATANIPSPPLRPHALPSSNYLPFYKFPLKNGYGVIGELSCGNELLNGFLERSRVVFLQEKRLQGG